MPTHRSVTISLTSQYDAVTIREKLSPTSKELLPIGSRTITANIPVLPSSEFWICYACPLPPPPKPGGDETRFYYFKLYVGGKCVLSWGVGEQEQWSGKTMFGLFDAGTDFDGRKVVGKRGLFFPKQTTSGEGFEIRVFRAKARKREETKYETFEDSGPADAGLSLTTIGRKKKGERQRMFTYALIDAVDAPYVTFRYIFRTAEQLRQLGDEDSVDGLEESFTSPNSEHTSSLGGVQGSSVSEADNGTPPPLVGEPKRRTGLRRLSIPPRKPLAPSTSQLEPSSPVKRKATPNGDSKSEHLDNYPPSNKSWSTATEPDGWTVRTPSPAADGSHLVSPPTPPSRRKTASSGLLRSVVASAMKRKENKNNKK